MSYFDVSLTPAMEFIPGQIQLLHTHSSLRGNEETPPTNQQPPQHVSSDAVTWNRRVCRAGKSIHRYLVENQRPPSGATTAQLAPRTDTPGGHTSCYLSPVSYTHLRAHET